MKIFSVLFPVLFIFFSLNIQAQKEIKVNYFRPYQYDAAKNTVKAWIDQKDSGKDFSISLDGKMINYSETDSGNSTSVNVYPTTCDGSSLNSSQKLRFALVILSSISKLKMPSRLEL